MSAADRDRWDARYATTAPVEASVPLPPDLLAGHEELLPASGRALDVACGCGATAVWLALRGLAVDAVDGSPVAIAAGAALARRPGPQADGGPGGGGGAAGRVGSDGTDSGTDSSTHGGADDGAAGGVRWRVHDLDQGLPPGWTGPYDVVVCQRFRDPALYPLLRAAVAPDGLLALTVLSVVGGRAGPYRAEPGELPAAFPGWRVIDQREGGGEAHLLARPPRSA